MSRCSPRRFWRGDVHVRTKSLECFMNYKVKPSLTRFKYKQCDKHVNPGLGLPAVKTPWVCVVVAFMFVSLHGIPLGLCFTCTRVCTHFLSGVSWDNKKRERARRWSCLSKHHMYKGKTPEILYCSWKESGILCLLTSRCMCGAADLFSPPCVMERMMIKHSDSKYSKINAAQQKHWWQICKHTLQ